jgi:hypothetical protein
MDAALPARFPFEVLHRVGDVNLVAIDPRFFQRPVEDFSSRADEWFASDILLIARLFAQEHKDRAFGSFAEDSLGGVAIEVAGRAVLGRAF